MNLPSLRQVEVVLQLVAKVLIHQVEVEVLEMDHNMQHKRCKHQHHNHNIHLRRVARRSQDIQPKEQQQQHRLRRVERERERQHQLPKEQQQQQQQGQREQQHVVAMEGQFHQDVAKVQHALQGNDKINVMKAKRYWLLTDLLAPSGTDSPNSAIRFMYSLSNWLSRSWD